MLYPRPLVSFLRRSDGGHEPHPASDRTSRRISRCHLPANRAAIFFHARPAQVALPAALRSRQQSREPIRPHLRVPDEQKQSTSAPSSTCHSSTETAVGSCRSRQPTSSIATARYSTLPQMRITRSVLSQKKLSACSTLRPNPTLSS